MDNKNRGQLEWRVVPVDELPFPNQLWKKKCPLKDEYRRIVAEVGNSPDQYERAFERFLRELGSRMAECPYHQADWDLITSIAAQAIEEEPGADDLADRAIEIAKARGVEDDHVFCGLEGLLVEDTIRPNTDWQGLQGGLHRVCAMNAGGVTRCPVQVLRDSQDELDLGNAQRVLRRSGHGQSSDTLQIGVLLTELDSWLGDERQWRKGEPRHWQSLIDDVIDRLRGLRALSSSPIQQRLSDTVDELTRLRKEFQKGEDPPDEALRRQLVRLSATVRSEIARPELLVMAWRRIIGWAEGKPQLAEEGFAVLRDVAEINGHDPENLFRRVEQVLADSAWQIAGIRGDQPPNDHRARAGEPADARLQLTDTLLREEARRGGGIVWLQFLEAELRYPWTLERGPHISLYQHDFLRSMVHQAPDDPRIPEDLRQGGGSRSHLYWFGANDPEEAVQAEQQRLGDPCVYLKLELPEMPLTRLLADARETAEFLTAFGNLASDNHDVWLLSNSYLSPALGSSTSAMVVSTERAERQRLFDTTATHLARHADDLARHLPLRTTELRMAGRLMVWLRQTGASDSPARVVLCDRVIEQVCGWAGVAQPWRFIESSLRPEWIHSRIRSYIQRSYHRLRFSPLGPHDLWQVIEPNEPEPPHVPRNSWIGSTNLRAILENIDELAKLAEGIDQGIDIQRLHERVSDRDAVRAWLDELGSEFDRRNKRLRRTRNALIHGGPITMGTVNHVSDFSMSLAYLAIGPTVNLLLKDRDLVDSLLDNRAQLERCFGRLRDGVPMSEALFLPEA